jgi:hypothetical protein
MGVQMRKNIEEGYELDYWQVENYLEHKMVIDKGHGEFIYS